MRKLTLLSFLLILVGLSLSKAHAVAQSTHNSAYRSANSRTFSLAAGVYLPRSERSRLELIAQAASPTPNSDGYTLLTATSNPDGSVIHNVKSGESLWNIALAYGIKMDDIKALNGLQATPVLQPGQKLVLRPAYTPTIAPTITKTPLPPTRTAQPTRTRRPPTAVSTVTLEPTLTPPPAVPVLAQVDRRAIGIGLIISCAIGILIVIIAPFRSKK